MKVYLDVHSSHVMIDQTRHLNFAEAVLKSAGELEAELSVTIVSDDEIQEINNNFRGVDKPTDVLSFAMREGEIIGQSTVLGDIVISIDTAQKQAQTLGHRLAEEIDELIFHGMIHLLGGDHETNMEKWLIIQNDLQNALQKLKIDYIPKGLINSDYNTQS